MTVQILKLPNQISLKAPTKEVSLVGVPEDTCFRLYSSNNVLVPIAHFHTDEATIVHLAATNEFAYILVYSEVSTSRIKVRTKDSRKGTIPIHVDSIEKAKHIEGVIPKNCKVVKSMAELNSYISAVQQDYIAKRIPIAGTSTGVPSSFPCAVEITEGTQVHDENYIAMPGMESVALIVTAYYPSRFVNALFKEVYVWSPKPELL